MVGLAAGTAPSIGGVVALQRAVGNRALTRLLGADRVRRGARTLSRDPTPTGTQTQSAAVDAAQKREALIEDAIQAVVQNETGGTPVESYLHTSAGVAASYANATQMIGAAVVGALKALSTADRAKITTLTKNELDTANLVMYKAGQVWDAIVPSSSTITDQADAKQKLGKLLDESRLYEDADLDAMFTFRAYKNAIKGIDADIAMRTGDLGRLGESDLLTHARAGERPKEGATLTPGAKAALIDAAARREAFAAVDTMAEATTLGMGHGDTAAYYHAVNRNKQTVGAVDRFGEDRAAWQRKAVERPPKGGADDTLGSRLKAAAEAGGGFELSRRTLHTKLSAFLDANPDAGDADVATEAALQNFGYAAKDSESAQRYAKHIVELFGPIRKARADGHPVVRSADSSTAATPPATTTPATVTPAPTRTLSQVARTLARQTAPGAGLPHPGQQPDHRNAFDAFVAACVATQSVTDLRAARTAVDLGSISSEQLLNYKDTQLWVDQENLTAVMTRIRWRAMDLINVAYLAGVTAENAETDEAKRRAAREGIVTKTKDWIAFLRDDPIKDPSSDMNRFEHWYAPVQGNVVSVLGLIAVASSLAAMPGQFPTTGAASSARQQTYDETGLPQFDKGKPAKADGSYPLTEWCGSFADMMRMHSGLNPYLAGRTQGTWGYWGVFNYTVNAANGFPPVFAWDGQGWVSVEALHTVRHARRLHWDFVNAKQDPFSLDLRPGDIVLIDNGSNPPNHVTSVLAYHKDPAGGHAWLYTIGGNEDSMVTDTTHEPATDLEKAAGTGLKDPTKVTPDNPAPNFSHVGVSVRDLTLDAPNHDTKGAAVPGRAGVTYNGSRVWGVGRFSGIDYENHRYAIQPQAPTAPPPGFGP